MRIRCCLLCFLAFCLTACGGLQDSSSGTFSQLPQIPGRNNQRFEAREWISSNPNTSPFAGNRFAGKQQALTFVDSLYHLGATSVFVSGILEEPWRIQKEGGPYADILIVQLPQDQQKRAALFEIANKEAEEDGFVPEQDTGQAELLLWWD